MKFYTIVSAFNFLVVAISLTLNFVWMKDYKIFCMNATTGEPNDLSCYSDTGYFRCSSFFGICEEEAWLPYSGVSLLTISLCSLAFICAFTAYGFVFRKNLPTGNHSKFIICMILALLTCFAIGPAGTRYVLLTDFYKSKQ